MKKEIMDCISGGYLHSAIGISRQIEYQDFSREDFIKLIDFCYSCFLQSERDLEYEMRDKK